ncbi:hypothetical protein [Glycomyces harbinensis]|uniref:Uncharacterized protein n=1 Tax=Glycomyces harbinensis TaxID=58114 RepID=A0A1G6RRS7_9ACTN|nr:hypothetical protein [Glycomyces harbinensis]SDD07329.1 hypothetical protein SAMN05216270_101630 [Glycomyces harbinensis]
MRITWHQWIGYATAVWTLAYGLLGLYWTFGGGGFPFGIGDAELMAERETALKFNLLGEATPETAGPVIAALGLAGTAVAVLMARGYAKGPFRWLLPAFAWTTAIGLTVAIQDYRTLIVVAYTPVMLIMKPFTGWADTFAWGDLYRMPRLNLLLCLLAGIAWALTAVAYRRRTSGGCERCGRADDRPSWIDRAGKAATWTAFAAPLIYCATRWAWALGLSLGIDPEFYREGQESGLWIAGAALATLGGLGAVLTLGLIQRWGEVFPRWMIGLRGKRVPPMLAVVPAVLVSVLVMSAAWMYVRVVAIDGVTAGTWPLTLPEVFWVVWGAALFVAAIAYQRRRRGECDACGRGRPEARTGSKPSALAR